MYTCCNVEEIILSGSAGDGAVMTRWVVLAVTLCIVYFMVPAAYSMDVTVQWNPNPEKGVGYKLHYGINIGGPYHNSLDVGSVTSATVRGLDPEFRWCFVATAYFLAKRSLESRPSNEVCLALKPGVDPDNDGIATAREYRIRTKPNNPDSDGDSFNDGLEVSASTNPLDSSSTPYVPAVPALGAFGVVVLVGLMLCVPYLAVKTRRAGKYFTSDPES